MGQLNHFGGAASLEAMAAGVVQASLGLKTNLAAWWELNEASGNRADSHTNGLTLTDNSTVGSAAGIGGVGTAASFNPASGEYFSRASSNWSQVQIDNYEWTVVAFIYINAKGTTRQVIGANNNGREFDLYFDNAADRFKFRVAGLGDSYFTVTADTFGSPSLSTWYMLTAQHDPTSDVIKIGVNAGTMDSTAMGAGGAQHIAGNELFIGVIDPAYFDGRMSKIGVFRSGAGVGGLLTSTQITQLYNSGAGRTYSEL